MIRAVLFDLDGTLYDRDAAIQRVAADQYTVFEERLTHVGRRRFIDRYLELDGHGYQSRAVLYRQMTVEFGLDATLAADLELHFWDSYMRRCDVDDDTWTTLRTLKAAGKTLGIVTNGPTEWQLAKVRGLGFDGFFDVVLVSEAEGVQKPDPRIFQRALERCAAAPGEAMFVGDHPQIDVDGARAAGMLAVWKQVPYWTPTHDDVLTINRLSEILAVADVDS